MKIITNPYKLREEIRDKEVGFVPTMGALHEGHLSLIQKARKENEIVVVSIFVNPTQFLEGEDLDKYPKRLEADAKICELAGVDYIFAPNIDEMYNDNDEVLIKAPKIRGYILEGHFRAGHFDGVLQIVLKLFNIVKPQKAYFGKKDAQQLSLIKQMVKNLFLDIEIIEGETIREKTGLALSSRNIYLSKEEKKRALSISKSLKLGAKLSIKEKNCKKIEEEMRKVLEVDKVQYIAFVDREFNYISKIEEKNSIILIAGFVGKTRLIDNIYL